uniref:F-box/LRR-repeat protein 15/At3g58940/PEG3-like LRR domain-containing protein n=1 Tax=Hyaloperonospora arabidopsidis (strain Emoy2) TaxID=559515 RepID=M4BHZ7_HYAAE
MQFWRRYRRWNHLCRHNSWSLRELVLTRVTCISGFYLHLLAEKLTKVTLCECYQVHEPAIIAPNLKALTIKYCPMARFHADTHLPELKSLSLCSRNFTAPEARHLIHEMLHASPVLETLNLYGCAQLEEVRVDPGELPCLRQLDVSSCAKLTRVQVTSKALEVPNLSHNDELQYLCLDLRHTVDLDLSFLKGLTHLDIRCPSLQRLNLRGCSRLTQTGTTVSCPNLQRVILHGTSLVFLARHYLNKQHNVRYD